MGQICYSWYLRPSFDCSGIGRPVWPEDAMLAQWPASICGLRVDDCYFVLNSNSVASVFSQLQHHFYLHLPGLPPNSHGFATLRQSSFHNKILKFILNLERGLHPINEVGRQEKNIVMSQNNLNHSKYLLQRVIIKKPRDNLWKVSSTMPHTQQVLKNIG